LMKTGDLIVGHGMGAYTWASSTEFNFFPRATVVAVNLRPGDGCSLTALEGEQGVIENVLFDIGWVFVRFDYRPLADFLRAHRAEVRDLHAALEQVRLSEHESGQVHGEELLARLAALAGRPVDPAALRALCL